MALPSCPASCPGLIRVIRESQSERAAVGVRGHNTAHFFYLNISVMEIFHYGLAVLLNFYIFLKKK